MESCSVRKSFLALYGRGWGEGFEISSNLVRTELGSEGGQRIEVGQGLPVWVQGLDTDMAGPGVEMFLDALPDCRFIPPGHHRIQKTVAATARQVILTEALAPPTIAIIG